MHARVCIQVTEEGEDSFASHLGTIIEVYNDVEWQWLSNDSSVAMDLALGKKVHSNHKTERCKTLLDVEGINTGHR